MDISVFELLVEDDGDFNQVRKWLVASIRGGDGLISEQSRYFLVAPGLAEAKAEIVLRRLEPRAARLRAKLVLRRRTEDELADSICRRAEAKILPVELRR